MKANIKYLLPIFFSILFIASCEKDDVVDDKMEFKFIGAIDTTLGRGEEFSRPLTVLYLGGKFERVSFSTEGTLPNGVEISYEPSTALIDSSVKQIIKVSSTADTGHFSIIVKAVAEEGGRVFSKEFDLHIVPAFNFKPKITLVFGNAIAQQLNSPFTEPGFHAEDTEDGDLTSQVRTYGLVDPDLVGIYTLSYAVTDSEGKTDSVTRTVNVLNDMSFLNPYQYDCKTHNFSTGLDTIWITSLSASVTVNNRVTIFKISSLFPANAYFDYDPSKDSIFIPAQTFTGVNPDTFDHTFEGAGKIFKTGTVIRVVIDYTDSYFDTNLGQQMLISKRDEYTN